MKISEELLAAYLEGNTNKEETLQVLNALANDPELREIVEVAMRIDSEFNDMPEFELSSKVEGQPEVKPEEPIAPSVSLFNAILPMLRFAAKKDENICSVICEAYILKHRNIGFVSEDLVTTAREHKWLKNEGTPLYAIGQLLVQKGLLITRKYNANLDDLKHCLAIDNDLIVAVDIQKLYIEKPAIDLDVNHAVVVTAVNMNTGVVSIFDPENETDADIPVNFFLNAWKDSQNYMVRVLKSIDEYCPEPIDLEDVALSDDLIELREAIAENLHDVWAITRIKEGWTYGPVRDDSKKQHPDIIPYCALPDGEKEYDRLMAWNTLKLVKKLGFEIKKR